MACVPFKYAKQAMPDNLISFQAADVHQKDHEDDEEENQDDDIDDGENASDNDDDEEESNNGLDF